MTEPIPLTDDQKAKVRRAADEIERRGLARNTLIDYGTAINSFDCAVCPLGALGIAQFGHPLDGYNYGDDEYRQMVVAVGSHLRPVPSYYGGDTPGTPVHFWADRLRPSKEAVVAKLRSIAA